MSHREASKILSISPNAPWIRRAMLAKHPDRNGSPYLAGKIHKPKNGLLEEEIGSDRNRKIRH